MDITTSSPNAVVWENPFSVRDKFFLSMLIAAGPFLIVLVILLIFLAFLSQLFILKRKYYSRRTEEMESAYFKEPVIINHTSFDEYHNQTHLQQGYSPTVESIINETSNTKSYRTTTKEAINAGYVNDE